MNLFKWPKFIKIVLEWRIFAKSGHSAYDSSSLKQDFVVFVFESVSSCNRKVETYFCFLYGNVSNRIE